MPSAGSPMTRSITASTNPPPCCALRERLDLAYAGTPIDAPADRAFAAIVAEYDMPRALPEALLEGLAWDGMGRRYASLGDLRAYSARVASAVGAMMCVLMRIRDRRARPGLRSGRGDAADQYRPRCR
jgi:phytoene/squalene synthetase